MGGRDIMAKSHLKLVGPATVKRTVAMPRRRPNADLRTREHLTESEVAKLYEAARGNFARDWWHRTNSIRLWQSRTWDHRHAVEQNHIVAPVELIALEAQSSVGHKLQRSIVRAPCSIAWRNAAQRRNRRHTRARAVLRRSGSTS